MKPKALMVAAEHARLYKICDEAALRNRIIQYEFEELKISLPNESVEKIILRLAEKYFLSSSRIRNICYPDNEEEKEAIKNINEIEEITEPTKPSIQKNKRRTYPRRR